jgi:hypothetical protein
LLTRKQTVEEYEKDQKLTARFGTASLLDKVREEIRTWSGCCLIERDYKVTTVRKTLERSE